jgi:hypothetical protein
LSISREKYLELLDRTGRQIRADKGGAIPASAAPILERLGIRDAKLMQSLFRSATRDSQRQLVHLCLGSSQNHFWTFA